MNWLKKKIVKLMRGTIGKLIDKVLSPEALRVQATVLNRQIDIPVLNEVEEQEVLEKVILPLGKHLRKMILDTIFK